jgi:glycosyltransferase involved in cell wall biosynthesis
LEPLVSVICITRNHERFCIESLDSVLNQTYKNIEWIILDAASTDSTVKLIDNWLVDNNVSAVFLKEKELKPVTVNLNKALTFAKGEYVQFLSLDDLLLPEKIKVQVNLFLKDNIDLVFTNSRKIGVNGVDFGSFKEKDYLMDLNGVSFKKKIRKGCFLLLQACLIKINVFNKIGKFDENLAIEDWDWFLRFWSYDSSLIAKYDYTENTIYRLDIVSLWYNRNYKLFESHFGIMKKHHIYGNQSNIINHINLFKGKSETKLIDKLKIIFYFLFCFRRISFLLFYITNNENLLNAAYFFEKKYDTYTNKEF